MNTFPDDNTSLWRTVYEGSLYPKLEGEVEVDVAIIGAGITGLTSAYLLKKAGLRVCVLDKDTVGGGTTGRTTGKVTSQHTLMYEDLEKRRGTAHARNYAEANQTAVELVDTIIRQEQIDCDWERDDNYVFTDDPKKLDQFRREADVAAQLGLPASFVTDLSLPFPIRGAVKFADQGKFWSQKYLLGLAKAVHGGGSYVFEQSNALSIRDGTPCTIHTPAGQVVSRDIIVATNVPTFPLIARGGYCILEYPTESYIISARYSGDLMGMYISPDSDHYSILPITVDGEKHLLIGGGGHLLGLRGSKKWRFSRLAKYGERYFGLTDFSHAWSDRDYVAYDEVPLIGKLYPWSKHMYVGTAYKKWGLSSGTVAAIVLTDLITGTENAWASTFTPQRLSPVTSIPRAVIKQIEQLNNP